MSHHHGKRSKHVINLRDTIPGVHDVNISHVDDVKKGSHAGVYANVNTSEPKPVQNAQVLNQPKANIAPQTLVKSFNSKPNAFTDVKKGFQNVFTQIQSAMQFVALTAVIFVLLFGLSNFSAYKEIVTYWYKTDIIQADKPDTPIDDLINPFKQDNESIILNQGKISQVNFQVRPADYRIYIPKIGKNLPIVQPQDVNLINQNWEGLEKDIQSSLRQGVVHYPSTAEPGQIGNMFLTAHSSWYPNDVLPYGLSSAFALLDKLVAGDKVYVFKSGEMFIYTVQDRFVVKPTTVSVLDQPTDKREMTLMTCTPVGTTINRMIIKLDQTYPSPDSSDHSAPQVPNLYNDGRLQA